MKKRLLALLMSLCLLVGLLPTAAWAAEEDVTTVESETELKNAIFSADGTRETPSRIQVVGNIEITTALDFTGKHIELFSENEQSTISASSIFTPTESSMVKVGDGTQETTLVLKNIKLQANTDDIINTGSYIRLVTQ